MKALVAALLIASPAAAFQPMTLTDCRNAWISAFDGINVGILQEFQGTADDFQAEVLRIATTLSSDGWCRLTGGSPGLEDAEFSTLDWQAEGIDRFIKTGAPPLAFRMRIKNLTDPDGDETPFDLSVSLRQVPGEGILLLENFDMSDARGDWIAATAVMGGAYFDSQSSTLSSLGGITANQVAVRVSLTPGRLSSDVFSETSLPDDLRDILGQMLDGLDATQLPSDSRSALQALLDDLPNARGDLNLHGVSERGLGWIQIGVAQTFNPDATPAEILGFALSGVTIDATWTPVE